MKKEAIESAGVPALDAWLPDCRGRGGFRTAREAPGTTRVGILAACASVYDPGFHGRQMVSSPLVYFDWNATAPLTEAVVVFLRTLEADSFLENGSSAHRPGQKQRARLEYVRAWLKQDLQADELVWTSSATEAHNLLFSGFETSEARADRSQRAHRVSDGAASSGGSAPGMCSGCLPPAPDGRSGPQKGAYRIRGVSSRGGT